jgi:hypothetical protein
MAVHTSIWWYMPVYTSYPCICNYMPNTYYQVWHIQVCAVTWYLNIFHIEAQFYDVSVSTDTYPIHSITYNLNIFKLQYCCLSKMKKNYIQSLRNTVVIIAQELDIPVYTSIKYGVYKYYQVWCKQKHIIMYGVHKYAVYTKFKKYCGQN